jgi:hypothetical protein
MAITFVIILYEAFNKEMGLNLEEEGLISFKIKARNEEFVFPPI